jgi:DNA replication protein DnaC
MSNCKKCCTPLAEYPILSETHFETLTACPNCQSRLITQLALTNRSVAEKCLKTETVPKRYWQAELTDKYKQFDGVEDVLEGNRGIYFIGKSGVGKSWLAVAWMLHFIYRGYKCHYINWSDFMVKLRTDIKYYDEMKRKALQYDCVFIDDFDATNQYMYDIVYNFVNTLYNAPKLTFFNSVDLPTQSKLAMRIGEMTKQVKLVRKENGN